MSINSTSPATFLGGTWEQITGRFLLGTGYPGENSDNSFGTIKYPTGWSVGVGSTGGEDFHLLTVNELPSHTHSLIRQQWYSSDDVANSAAGTIYSWKTSTGGSTSASYISNSGRDVGSTGGNIAHNNFPPYLGVYMWKRTA